MGLFSAELYKLWSTYHSLGRVLHSQSSNMIVLIARRVFFLIQFMKSHNLLFDNTISCIFSLKNFLLILCNIDLYVFQLNKSSYS